MVIQVYAEFQQTQPEVRGAPQETQEFDRRCDKHDSQPIPRPIGNRLLSLQVSAVSCGEFYYWVNGYSLGSHIHYLSYELKKTALFTISVINTL